MHSERGGAGRLSVLVLRHDLVAVGVAGFARVDLQRRDAVTERDVDALTVVQRLVALKQHGAHLLSRGNWIGILKNRNSME